MRPAMLAAKRGYWLCVPHGSALRQVGVAPPPAGAILVPAMLAAKKEHWVVSCKVRVLARGAKKAPGKGKKMRSWKCLRRRRGC